jgi:hypothetical protein
MPVYACMRGDCNNLALSEDNCFALSDARGRDWLCFETALKNLDDSGPLIIETLVAQRKLSLLGQAAEGTQISMHDCQDMDELRKVLSTA